MFLLKIITAERVPTTVISYLALSQATTYLNGTQETEKHTPPGPDLKEPTWPSSFQDASVCLWLNEDLGLIYC